MLLYNFVYVCIYYCVAVLVVFYVLLRFVCDLCVRSKRFIYLFIYFRFFQHPR